MIVITLSKEEIQDAASVGAQRNINSICAGHGDVTLPAGKTRPYWESHIEGACAELAFSLYIGIPWQRPVNTFKFGGDVGPYQVRLNTRWDGGLIIRPDDDQHLDDIYYLVVGKAPRFGIVGWFICRDARIDFFWHEFYNGRPDAWQVPQQYLNQPHPPEYVDRLEPERPLFL